MKVKNKKSIYSLLPIFGLVFILLLSPCKVRNFVQVKLGTPQTEVSNKSKVIISSSNCSDIQITTASVANKQCNPQQLAVFTANAFSFFSVEVVHLFYQTNIVSKKPITVPFYILYQNFKDYL